MMPIQVLGIAVFSFSSALLGGVLQYATILLLDVEKMDLLFDFFFQFWKHWNAGQLQIVWLLSYFGCLFEYFAFS